MPKMKTHKGSKKRFRVSATGKVSHKRCGSSHLNSHKSGAKIRRLRKKSFLKVRADAHRYRRGMQKREGAVPEVTSPELAPGPIPAGAEASAEASA